MSLIIRLPFPDKKLMPNKKNGKHWTSTVKVKNEQKAAAAVCTKTALELAGPTNFEREFIPLSLLYISPDKRHRDLDNLLASSKAMLDAVAEQLGINDRRFKPILVDQVAGDGEGALIAAVGVQIQSGVSFTE